MQNLSTACKALLSCVTQCVQNRRQAWVIVWEEFSMKLELELNWPIKTKNPLIQIWGIRAVVNLERITESLAVTSWEYTQRGTPVHREAPYTHTHIYTQGQFILANLLACFWVSGKKTKAKQRTRRKPTQTREKLAQKHCTVTQAQDQIRKPGTEREQHYLYYPE